MHYNVIFMVIMRLVGCCVVDDDKLFLNPPNCWSLSGTVYIALNLQVSCPTDIGDRHLRMYNTELLLF